MSAIVLIDNQRASLTVARALAARGRTVYAAVTGPCDYVHWSRHVSRAFEIAPLDSAPEQAARDLNALFAARTEIEGVFPLDETGVRFLADFDQQLPARIRRYCPAPDLVKRCIDKADTAALCERIGVPVAARRTVDNVADLYAASAAIGFPQVIRAVESNHNLYGQKVAICRSAEEFESVVEGRWPEEEHLRLTVQRYNRGARHNLYWLAQHGEIYAGCHVRTMRTTTHGASGYATLAMSVEPDPELKDYVERIVADLGYHGAGFAQFLKDEQTGEVTFLEINPRLGAFTKSVHAIPMPFTDWILDLTEGRALPPRPEPWAYRRGVKTMWLKGENQAYKNFLRAGEPGALIRRLAVANLDALRCHHATFTWSDPAPALGCHLHPLLSKLPARLMPRKPLPAPMLAEQRA